MTQLGNSRRRQDAARPWFLVLVAATAFLLLLPVADASATTVNISISGSGVGAISGGTAAEPIAIDCSNASAPAGPSCSHDFGSAIASISLAATAAPGSAFVGWSGPGNAGTCKSGSASSCSLTNSPLVPTVTITATFAEDVSPPEVQIEPVAGGDVTASEAAFHGSVNPKGSELKACHFEYLTQARYQSNGNNFNGAEQLPCDLSRDEIGEDEDFVDVEATATGLEPHTTYRVRLLAEKENVAPVSAEAAPFTTASQAPSIGLAAASANPTFASLYALINPHNEPTSYRFEWGLTSQYGQTVPVPSGTIPAASEPKTVVALIEGLAPATTYHFRVAASNAQVSETLDRTFTTPAQPLLRGYELVSSGSKQGADAMASPLVCCGHSAFVNNGLVSSGKAIWTDRGAMPNPDPTNGRQNWYASSRNAGAGNWDVQTLAPTGARSDIEYKVRAASDDLSTQLLESRQFEPAKGSQEDSAHFLRRPNGDFVPVPLDGTPPPGGIANLLPSERLSPDGGRVILSTPFYLLPEDNHVSGSHQVYQWTESSGLRLLGTDEGGDPLSPCGALLAGGGGREVGLQNRDISTSGSRVLIQSPDPSFPSGAPANCKFGGAAGNTYVSDLYLREGERIVNISRPPAGTPDFGARMVDATADLSQIFFVTESALPDDDPSTPEKATQGPGHLDLYRYDTASEALTRLSVAAEGGEEDANLTPVVGGTDAKARAAIMASDGNTVYFTAIGQLLPGQGRSASENGATTANLYMWRQGQGLRFVANVAGSQSGRAADAPRTAVNGAPLWTRTAAVTPSGSVLVFNTTTRLTAYDNQGAGMLYRYDAASGEISCVTCSPAGTPLLISNGRSPIFRTSFASGAEQNSTPLSQLGGLSADGSTVVFASSDPLLPAVRNASNNGSFPVYNIFAWHAGGLQLISTGTSPSSDELLGASPDGEDIYFLTASRLVGRDHDDGYDIYSARLGGGFPEAPPSPPCAGQECRAPVGGAPSIASAGTDAFVGAGNLRARPKRCGKGQVRRAKRCVSKRKLAQRICRGKSGHTKRRCVRRQMKRLSVTSAGTSGKARRHRASSRKARSHRAHHRTVGNDHGGAK